MIRTTAVILIVACLVACSTTGNLNSRASQRIITAEEIMNSSAKNAFEAVQYLRPQFLNRDITRTSSMYANVLAIVIVNGVRVNEGKAYLKTIRSEEIQTIEYLSPSEATSKWGTGAGGGAFVVTLR